MSIKYYHLTKGETPPEEFCAVRDVGGEPSEYVFYVPESDVAKLRELVKNLYECNGSCERCVELMGRCEYKEQLSELGIEVEE